MGKSGRVNRLSLTAFQGGADVSGGGEALGFWAWRGG